MTTSRDLQASIQNLLDYLANAEIALVTSVTTDTPHKFAHRTNVGRRVTWASSHGSEGELFRQVEPTVGEYLDWVEHAAYSAMLFDGSLLQLTFDVEGGELVGHRLAYVPCPFNLDPTLLLTEPMVDLLRLYAGQTTTEVRIRTTVRFDFDPANQALGHPASHVSFNFSHCRIACATALSLGHFIAFIFYNFYPELWLGHKYLRELPRARLAVRTISTAEELAPHVTWRESLPSN